MWNIMACALSGQVLVHSMDAWMAGSYVWSELKSKPGRTDVMGRKHDWAY